MSGAAPAPGLAADPAPARLDIGDRGGARVLAFHGALDTAAAGKLWPAAMRAARQGIGRPLVLDLAGLTFCDTAGADFCSLDSGFIACAATKSALRVAYKDWQGRELRVVDIPA